MHAQSHRSDTIAGELTTMEGRPPEATIYAKRMRTSTSRPSSLSTISVGDALHFLEMVKQWKGNATNGADAKVRRTVGWYNKNGGLQQDIIYSKVGPLLMQLGADQAGIILKQLESKAGEVRNPTAWLCTAARKHGAVGGADGGQMQQWADASQTDVKIRRTVGWYNAQGNLKEEIKYSKVAPLLNQLDARSAGAILKSLAGKEDEINNPTSWIAAAAKKRGCGSGSLSPAVARTIGWYNRSGSLQEQINFDEVAMLFSQLDPSLCLKMLKGLEPKAAEIKNPTAWLASAARKAGASG